MTSQSYHIILASASPRRQELLRTSGLTPLIQPSRIEEIRDKEESPIAYCQRLAREKAISVASTYPLQRILLLLQIQLYLLVMIYMRSPRCTRCLSNAFCSFGKVGTMLLVLACFVRWIKFYSLWSLCFRCTFSYIT